MRRKFFYVPSMIALAFAVAFAQQPSSNQPSVDRLRQVIEYLASDALEGRRTGTPGANDAAHYIAGEFNRYGLRPGMQMARPARTRGENQARYLQPFPYVAGVELGKNNLFFVNRGRPDDAMQFLVGNDWMPVGFSSNGQVEAAPAVREAVGGDVAVGRGDPAGVVGAQDKRQRALRRALAARVEIARSSLARRASSLLMPSRRRQARRICSPKSPRLRPSL